MSRYPSLKNYDQERVIDRIRGFEGTGIDPDTAKIMAESEERARAIAERQEKLNKEPQYATAKDLRFPVLKPEQLAKDTGMSISEAEKLLATMPLPDRRRVRTAQKLMEQGKELEALRVYGKIVGVRVIEKKATKKPEPQPDNFIKLSRYDNDALAQEFEDADEGETTFTMGRGRFESEYPEPEFDPLNLQDYEDADEGETTFTMGRGRFAPKPGINPGLATSIVGTQPLPERDKVGEAGQFLVNLPIATLAGAGVVRDIKIIKESKDKEAGAALTLQQLNEVARAAGYKGNPNAPTIPEQIDQTTNVYKSQLFIRDRAEKAIRENKDNQARAQARVQEKIANLDFEKLQRQSADYASDLRGRLEGELADAQTLSEVRGFRSQDQIDNMKNSLTRDIRALKNYENRARAGSLPPFPKIANYGQPDQRLINRYWGYTPDEWQKEIAIQMAVAGLTYGAGKLPIFRGGTSGGGIGRIGGTGPTRPGQTPKEFTVAKEFIESGAIPGLDDIGKVRTDAGLKAGRSYLNPTDDQFGNTMTAVLEKVKIKQNIEQGKVVTTKDIVTVATPEEAAIIAGASNAQIGRMIIAGTSGATAGVLVSPSAPVVAPEVTEVEEIETPSVTTPVPSPDIGIGIEDEEIEQTSPPTIAPTITPIPDDTGDEPDDDFMTPSPSAPPEPIIEAPEFPEEFPEIGISEPEVIDYDRDQRQKSPAEIADEARETKTDRKTETETRTNLKLQLAEELRTQPQTELEAFLETPSRVSTTTGTEGGTGRPIPPLFRKKGKGPKRKAVVMGVNPNTPDIVGWKQGNVYRYKDLRTGQEAISKKPLPKYQIRPGRTPQASLTVVKRGLGVPTEFTDSMGVVKAQIGRRGRTIRFNRRGRR